MNMIHKTFSSIKWLFSRTGYLSYLLMVNLMWAGSVHAQSWQISAETWASPRSAIRLVDIKPLSEAVRVMNELPDATLLVAFPAGETGTLWASELRDWMVALGVPSARILLKENPRNDLTVKLSLVK